jgi:hypothetical protein
MNRIFVILFLYCISYSNPIVKRIYYNCPLVSEKVEILLGSNFSTVKGTYEFKMLNTKEVSEGWHIKNSDLTESDRREVLIPIYTFSEIYDSLIHLKVRYLGTELDYNSLVSKGNYPKPNAMFTRWYRISLDEIKRIFYLNSGLLHTSFNSANIILHIEYNQSNYVEDGKSKCMYTPILPDKKQDRKYLISIRSKDYNKLNLQSNNKVISISNYKIDIEPENLIPIVFYATPDNSIISKLLRLKNRTFDFLGNIAH